LRDTSGSLSNLTSTRILPDRAKIGYVFGGYRMSEYVWANLNGDSGGWDQWDVVFKRVVGETALAQD
jgi:hypothetical protein